jgi:putative tryptophan/tyrosine transport system substrate-binding protein
VAGSDRLDLLHQAVPAADSIALLVGAANSPYNKAEARLTQSAAQALGPRLFVLNVTTDSEVAAAFATMVAQRVGAVLAAGRDGEAECLGSLCRATARPSMSDMGGSLPA